MFPQAQSSRTSLLFRIPSSPVPTDSTPYSTMDLNGLRSRLSAHGQGHLLRHWDALDEEARRRLYDDVSSIDFERLARDFKEATAEGEAIPSVMLPLVLTWMELSLKKVHMLILLMALTLLATFRQGRQHRVLSHGDDRRGAVRLPPGHVS